MATAIINDLLVVEIFNFMISRGFLTVSDLLKAPSPLAAKLATEEKAIIWIKEHLSTDERFAVEEDHGKIVSVSIVSKVRMCLLYAESGTCPLKGRCKFWHVCKYYIEGNCETECRQGKSHDFHDEQNGLKTEKLGFGKLERGTIRSIFAVNYPRVCSAYVQGPCVDTNCCFLHLCAGFVKKTCYYSFECNQSHDLRSDHNKSVLKKNGLDSSSAESYLLCNILLPKKTTAPTNTPGDSIKTAAEQHVLKSAQNNPESEKYVNSGDILKPDLSIMRKPSFKSQAGRQSQSHQRTPCSLNLNFSTSPDEEEAETLSEDGESVDISEPRTVHLLGDPPHWVDKGRGMRSTSHQDAETEFQVDLPIKGECGSIYSFPKQPSKELPPKQDMSFPHPEQSQNASEEFGAVGGSSSCAEKSISFSSWDEEKASRIKDKEQQPPLPEKTMVSSHRGAPTSSSVTSKMEPVQISEKQVFECICKEFDCSVKLSDISGRADLFPNGKADAEAWFRKDARKNSFIITEGDNKEILEIAAFSSRLRLCFSGSYCQNDECSFFHVCRNFISGCCKSGAKCKQEHEFRNEKDRQLVSNLKIFNSFTEEQLRRIFRASTPHVCLDYNAGKCQKGKNCSKIHVCKDFVRKRCLRTACSLDHDDAYETPHTKALAEKFRMSVQTLKRARIVVQPPQGQLTDEPAHICSDFILGQCKNGGRCAKYHREMPYQWQYKDPGFDNKWITCKKDRNTLERYYCDPSNGDNVAMNFKQTPFHTDGVMEMVVDFENMTMLHSSLSHWPIQMRRLSTESSVMNSDNPLATTWTWYWQDEDSLWEKYGSQSGSEREVQRRIETAFLDPSNNGCGYRTSEHSYVLNFRDKSKGMYQKNQRHDTERKIRRRPEFRSTDEIRQLKKKWYQHPKSSQAPQASDEQHPGLPSHWSRMSQGKEFERVTLSHNSQEFTKVKKLFHKTMSEEEKIISKIERVQNPYMWDKFARKKQNMKSKSRGSSLEKDLFHGTDPDTVEKICKENFDWRLYGKNATKYGQGSYFALNASYSDRYAQQANHNSSHFMFLAKVLVGSYVKGDSTMRRPPPKNPSDPTSDLYDSCVDDKDNPEIFVVFDMDQCYPSYVIEYCVALSRRLHTGGSRSSTRSTSSRSAARVRAALAASSALQTT